MALVFEWDPQKARANWRKHRVRFDEAMTVFGDPLAEMRLDPRNAAGEERWVILGMSTAKRLLAVMFTERGRERIRIFSARRPTAHERRTHEENSP